MSVKVNGQIRGEMYLGVGENHYVAIKVEISKDLTGIVTKSARSIKADVKLGCFEFHETWTSSIYHLIKVPSDGIIDITNEKIKDAYAQHIMALWRKCIKNKRPLTHSNSYKFTKKEFEHAFPSTVVDDSDSGTANEEELRDCFDVEIEYVDPLGLMKSKSKAAPDIDMDYLVKTVKEKLTVKEV
mmetsp:Transcript_31686/g.39058  ORF Transcript_31686/g.39058 Transcript_31686/m.39058 type:complete len:185 (-) Transcript_31686:1392-1946(-)|eukprot:CAMPEP_0204833274 /NCGR_PEP_ID=MMETSP1346-20131115/16283_1 /ASSEMBLY_ACC=CAM_ASM_000771 /TAXON_ID=215587 /ORGANISM="Aplanochytrium stocchinoi, Strain GSBS06" /LENGTH=184 /DNA_ID=CAMNT_0051965685 /DNA_START=232 /DNA_END=786 /DNA_ORIENTATION=+